MRGVIEAPVVAYHTPFLADLTPADAADEQAYRATLDAQAEAEGAELAEIEALLREEDAEREGEANERDCEVFDV